jgi:threonine/homoserine/homoserine lactone efflux protein
MTTVVIFAGIVLLACMSPGPDFALMVRNVMLAGRASGVWTALGIALGVSVWVVATAAGLAALLAASATAFTFVKIAGAAYLVYLGFKSIRGGGGERRRIEVDAVVEPRVMTRGQAFRSGLLCNVLNPKAAVFFTALMPQFVGSHSDWVHVGELAVVATGITAVWFLVLANLVGLLRRFLTHPKVRAWINGLTGGVMVALGVRIAASN